MSERSQVKLRASNLAVLRQLIHEQPLDLDCGGPRREADGAITVMAFVTEDDMVYIRNAKGVEMTEVIDLTEVSRSHFGEVGVGDRFNGGRITPRGFGRKHV